MYRTAALLYGALCYLAFFLTSVYSVGFVGDFWVPKSIDSGSPHAPATTALGVDGLLLGIFALQHSVMARPGFKRWWTRLLPASIERSTYVLLSSLALMLLFWQWQPMPAAIWDAGGSMAATVLTALFWLGWLVVVLSTFMISHWDLFGLRQVLLNWQGETYRHPPFTTRGLYKWVRHPIMLGFVIAFWATPMMTLGHLLFAFAMTGYILIALRLEERDLIEQIGQAYMEYRKRVPMLLPWRR